MAPLLNRWRLAERILLMFPPVLTPNGDHEAIVTAHALGKEHDCELAANFEPALFGEMSTIPASQLLR
jgi:hypothetical protein